MTDDKTDMLDLTITKVNSNACGEVFHQGQKFVVPFVLLGEKVRVQIIQKKKSFTVCRLLSVLESSQKRRDAKCPCFGVCGGCDLQHIVYEEQLRLKQEWVTDLIEKNSFLKGVVVHPIIGSDKEYNYRNRITLHIKGQNKGFYQQNSHAIVPIERCEIASEELNQRLNELDCDSHQDEEFFELRKNESAGFLQVNPGQNKRLVDLVLAHCQNKKWKKALDLYCGSGNFTFPLARVSKRVLGVDNSDEAIFLAEEKRLKTKNKKIKFVSQSCLDKVHELVQGYEQFDLIVCDPPREGLQMVANYMTRLKPKKIIYVSCHLLNFINDAKVLCKNGMRLTDIFPLDMFPQTKHVEIVGVFC